jgi:16S rRNA (adenine1518-N6/adenine1519-N6)-dimethyltransferase
MGPKKQLGQHFLTSPAYAERIVEAIPAASHETVLEVGPGRGALTIFLTGRFKALHCVEIDHDAISILMKKIQPETATIHHHDILTFDFAKVGFPLHVTGNLPYAIGARIIKKTLLYGKDILSITFMLQREVAERIVARPCTKTNGFLTIFCQFFGSPGIICHIPPGAFFPRPSVDSSVVRMTIDRHVEERLPKREWNDFFGFVSKGFSQRRKKLAKVIGVNATGKARAESILHSLGFETTVRPEELGINQWLALYRQWTS